MAKGLIQILKEIGFEKNISCTGFVNNKTTDTSINSYII